jgi:hypothetical protein
VIGVVQLQDQNGGLRSDLTALLSSLVAADAVNPSLVLAARASMKSPC